MTPTAQLAYWYNAVHSKRQLLQDAGITSTCDEDFDATMNRLLRYERSLRKASKEKTSTENCELHSKNSSFKTLSYTYEDSDGVFKAGLKKALCSNAYISDQSLKSRIRVQYKQEIRNLHYRRMRVHTVENPGMESLFNFPTPKRLKF